MITDDYIEQVIDAAEAKVVEMLDKIATGHKYGEPMLKEWKKLVTAMNVYNVLNNENDLTDSEKQSVVDRYLRDAGSVPI